MSATYNNIFQQDPLYSTFIYDPRKPPDDENKEKDKDKDKEKEWTASNKWFQLPSHTQAEISARVQKILTRRMQCMKTWKAYSKPMLPIIHGTFPSPHEKYDDFSFSSLPPQKSKGINNHFNNSRASSMYFPKPSLIFQ